MNHDLNLKHDSHRYVIIISLMDIDPYPMSMTDDNDAGSLVH